MVGVAVVVVAVAVVVIVIVAVVVAVVDGLNRERLNGKRAAAWRASSRPASQSIPKVRVERCRDGRARTTSVERNASETLARASRCRDPSVTHRRRGGAVVAPNYVARPSTVDSESGSKLLTNAAFVGIKEECFGEQLSRTMGVGMRCVSTETTFRTCRNNPRPQLEGRSYELD